MPKKEEVPAEKSKLLADDKGNVSTMRIATVSSVVTILGMYVAQNIQAMIKGVESVDFGTNSFYIMGAVLGGKALQKFAELKKKL